MQQNLGIASKDSTLETRDRHLVKEKSVSDFIKDIWKDYCQIFAGSMGGSRKLSAEAAFSLNFGTAPPWEPWVLLGLPGVMCLAA
jgi:hypothetical protein